MRVILEEEAEDVVGENARGRAGEVDDDVAVGARVLARVEAVAAQGTSTPGAAARGESPGAGAGAAVGAAQALGLAADPAG